MIEYLFHRPCCLLSLTSLLSASLASRERSIHAQPRRSCCCVVEHFKPHGFSIRTTSSHVGCHRYLASRPPSPLMTNITPHEVQYMMLQESMLGYSAGEDRSVLSVYLSDNLDRLLSVNDVPSSRYGPNPRFGSFKSEASV